MAELPVISGRTAVRIFQKEGWRVVRQKGSHMILVKNGCLMTLSVPDHKELDRGTLRGIIRASGMTVERFCSLIK